MKVLLVALSIAAVSAKECTKSKAVATGVPSCIQQKIDTIKAQPKWNPPAQVIEYKYGGKTVYLFSANCCDQYNVVYDSNCNYVCAPSGGMTGKGDRKCAGFDSSATLVRVVWKDERTAP